MKQKTLLAVQSHSLVNDTVRRHWPYYVASGCDILGVGREDTVCLWPLAPGVIRGNQRFVGWINVGKEGSANGDNHLRRVMDILLTFLTLEEYTHAIVTEYDSLFFRPPPEHPGGLVAKVAGYRTEGFRGERFFHMPLYVDRPTAAAIIGYGEAMISVGMIEHGFIDRFLGLMVDLYPLKWTDTGDTTYTQNSIYEQHVPEVRDMIRRGGWFCHGVKTEAILHAITEGLCC